MYSTSSQPKIPLMDLKASHQSLAEEIESAIAQVIDQTSYIGGPDHQAFEKEFAGYCNAKFAIGVSNGTDALTLILKGLGVGPGDEVITTAHTFIASAEAATLCGAKVVFADIDPVTRNLDPTDVEGKVTAKTKAIIAVHLYGLPADMDRLGEIAHRRGIHLVEDCAQAHGAHYHGQRVGSIGIAGGFSFYPGKNLGAYGDAGAVVTNDEKLATFVRKFANHGRLTKYEHDFVGTNCRLDGMQAAILRVKLRNLDRWNQQRQNAARLYNRLLAGVTGLTLPTAPADREHVYHLYAVELSDREKVAGELARLNISTGVHYPVPLHLQPAYRHLGVSKGSLPNTERAAERVLSLPMFPEITAEQVERVCNSLRQILGAGPAPSVSMKELAVGQKG